jgi:hypothetical protein
MDAEHLDGFSGRRSSSHETLRKCDLVRGQFRRSSEADAPLLAAARPEPVRSWISSRSNSAIPANIVNTMWPAGNVVSAQGSCNERKPASAARSLSAMSSIARRAGEAIETRDNNDILGSDLIEQSPEHRPVALGPRYLFLKDTPERSIPIDGYFSFQ